MSRVLFALLCVMWAFPAYAGKVEDDSAPASASTRIQSLFSQLEIAGNAYNGGGGGAAAGSVLSSGCAALSGSDEVRALMNEELFERFGLSGGDGAGLAGFARQQLGSASTQIVDGGLSMACSALAGQSVASAGGMADSLQDHLTLAMVSGAQALARGSGLPFMGHLELETALERDEIVSTITTVQPLWTDRDGFNVLRPGHKPEQAAKHHVFTQLSWRRIEGEDTLNTGVAYRNLNEAKTVLWGLNAFFDHGFEKNHNRMSLGADIRTSLLGLSANRYLGLSDWRESDLYTEERAASGWDVEVNGQVPQLPSWTASLKAYQWDGTDNLPSSFDAEADDKTYGYVGALEYAPVPALAIRGGVRNESGSSPSAEFALRFNLAFNQPLDLQFKPRTQLASVEERVYEKVSRENTIRVKKRRKDAGILTVVESIGANTVSGQPGVVPIAAGQNVLLPATLSVTNAPGAVARLRFSDGAILTAGQNTHILIEIDRITLISGSAQYTSGSVNRIINAPGAVIVLLGTDIDIVSAGGTSSTVRVREGSIQITGTASGVQTITVSGMAQSANGVVGTVASGTAAYDAHTDQISERIDRAASPIAGQKVAPYPSEAPRLISTATNPGQPIVIGLRFNTAVTVAGGTPRLAFTINGQNRTANLTGGSGTNDLQFTYTLQVGDIGATDILVTELDPNGAAVTGDGKNAVTTIADAIVSLDEVTGAAPSLNMNFLTNSYSVLGTTYNSLSSFLTATGGAFTRNSIGTYFDSSGVLQTASANQPRFDHDPITHAPKGILLEEQRTNILLRSSQFNTAPWGSSAGVAFSVAPVTAPDGTMSASTITLSATGSRSTSQAFTRAANYAGSVWVRAGTATVVSVGLYDHNGGAGTLWDSPGSGSTIRILSGPGTTSNWLAGGGLWVISGLSTTQWTRISITRSSVSDRFLIYPNNPSFQQIGDSIHIWGAQVESGTFATSYIPTAGTTMSRPNEDLIIPVGSWYNQAAGTFYTDVSWALAAGSDYPMFWRMDDGTFSNRWNAYYAKPTQQVGVNGYLAATWQGEFHANYPFTGNAKVAAAQALNDTNVAFDGNLSVLDTTWNPPTVNRLVLEGWGGQRNIRRLTYYPARLPDSELQTLSGP